LDAPEQIGQEPGVPGLVLDLELPAAAGVAADADVGAQQEDHDQQYRDAEAGGLSGVEHPLRFDYDAREGIHKPVTHPKSHLTLGKIRSVP